MKNCCQLIPKKQQDFCQLYLQFISWHNEIKKAMIQNKFTALKAFRQIFFDSLFNNPWACKTYQCIWFGNSQIAQHTERGRDAAKCWIG